MKQALLKVLAVSFLSLAGALSLLGCGTASSSSGEEVGSRQAD